MPTPTSPRFERVFIQPQTAFQTVPNSAGTWTQTGAKLLRSGVNGCKIKADPPLIPVPWKTGTRSTQPGIVGRKSGASWSLNNLPVIPSGTAGTAPDMDPLLQGIFGQAGSVSAGVSVTYSFLDAGFVPFVLARFMHSQTGNTQQFGFGALVTEASFALNGNVFETNASGPLYWALDSENFANEDTAGKGGLTTYPTEVSSPTVVGSILQGFQGVATFDGNGMDLTTAPLIACNVRIRTGNYYTQDAFGNSYPGSLEGGERMISVSASFVDNDTSALNNLKVKAKSKTPMNVTLQIGQTAGSIITMTIKSIQLSVPDYSEDGARVITAFGESAAHASAISAVDDFALVLT